MTDPSEFIPVYCAALTRQQYLGSRYHEDMANFRRSLTRGTTGRAYAVRQDGRWVCGHCGAPVSVAW